MKKTLIFVLVLVVMLSITPVASAATIPAENITLTVQTVDYVSAMAGVAKPVSKEYHDNERFAALITIDVPTWFDASNMSVIIEQSGLSIESTVPAAVATGNYLIFGTLFSSTANMKITLQDNAIENASTAQELWAALYGDRSISTTLYFTPLAPMAGHTTVPTTPALEIPQTGDAPGSYIALACFAGAIACFIFALRRRYKEALQ